MKTKNIFITSIASVTLLAGVFQSMWGCEGHISGLRLSRSGTNSADSVKPIDDPSNAGKKLFEEKWIQPDLGTGFKKLDVVFAVDASGSMTDEVNAISKSMATFVQTLVNQGVDICVGVIWGIGTGSYGGKFISSTNLDEDRILCSSDSSLTTSTLVSKLEANLRVNADSFIDLNDRLKWDGAEGAFGGVRAAKSSTNFATNKSLGFFRDNAALAVFSLSDENELSESPFQNSPGPDSNNCLDLCSQINVASFSPAALASVQDKECCYEAFARLNYYSDATGKQTYGYADYYRDLKSFQGTLLFIHESVVYNNPATLVAATGEEEIGYGHIQASELSGGDVIDLTLATKAGGGDSAAQQELDQNFDNLANAISKKANLFSVFDLSKKACPATVRLTVDGTEIAPDTLVISNDNKRVSIPVNNLGNTGSQIIAKYQEDKGDC